MTYLEGDSWTHHEPVWTKCAECLEEFDDQEGEGNICPPCVSKSYGWEEGTVICGDHLRPVKDCGCRI